MIPAGVLGSAHYVAASSLPTQYGHWDFSDTASLTYSDGTHITAVADQTANAFDLTVTSGSILTGGTVNSLNVVTFAGSTNPVLTRAISTLSQPFTVWLVLANASSSGTQMPMTLGASGPYMWVASGAATINAGTSLDSGGTIAVSGGPYLYLGVFNGSSSTAQLDGTSATGSAGTTSASKFTIGGFYDTSPNYGWPGDICEAGVMNSAASGTDISDIRSYVQSKWGTA